MSNIDSAAIEQIVQWLQAAGDKIMEQAPLLAADTLRAGLIRYGLTLALCTVAGPLCLWLLRWAGLQRDKGNLDEADILVVTVGAVVIGGLSLIGWFISVYWLLVVAAAPRYYIVTQVLR